MSGKDIRDTVGLLAVVAGLVFVGLEIRQNTIASQAQTRDSITEKKMAWTSWIGPNRDAADVYRRGRQGYDQLDPTERLMFGLMTGGLFREWENSHYQSERGLFTPEEFEARRMRWEANMALPGIRQNWAGSREAYSPSFRSEIDRIVDDLTP